MTGCVSHLCSHCHTTKHGASCGCNPDIAGCSLYPTQWRPLVPACVNCGPHGSHAQFLEGPSHEVELLPPATESQPVDDGIDRLPPPPPARTSALQDFPPGAAQRRRSAGSATISSEAPLPDDESQAAPPDAPEPAPMTADTSEIHATHYESSEPLQPPTPAADWLKE